jgi:hypothetical protein
MLITLDVIIIIIIKNEAPCLFHFQKLKLSLLLSFLDNTVNLYSSLDLYSQNFLNSISDCAFKTL